MSKTKELIKVLNENLEKLNDEDNKIFTNIIINIRFAGISENDAEEFLQQILDATLEAEKQGKNIKDVLGTDDVESYCKNIINEYKSRYPFWKKISNYLSTLLLVLMIFTGVYEFIISIITNSILNNKLVLNIDVTLNTLVSYGIAYLFLLIFFKYVIKLMDIEKNNYLILFGMNVLLIGLFVCSQLLFKKYILFNFNFIYFVCIVPTLYLITTKLSK